jgi:molybdate-binding protein/DNA-binding XRE family transcriptional regulator
MAAWKQQLSRHRLDRGWSQEELARRTGLSRAAVSAIETGRVVPSTAAALALAAAFECRVEDLFSLGEAGTPGQPQWAWAPRSDPCPFWRATIGARTLAYPAERTAVGLMPGDGTMHAGRCSLTTPADPQRILVLAGCDPAVGLLRSHVLRTSGYEMLPLLRSSREALALLRRDVVHVAGIHLQEHSRTNGNAHTVRELLGPGYTLLRVTRWEEGVALAPRLDIRTIKEAVSARLRWVAREEGSGARQCLDAVFRGRHAGTHQFDHVAADHTGVVEAIRAGWAHAGVCVRACAAEAGLGFITVRQEDYDLCYRSDREDDPRLQALFTAVRSAAFRQSIGALPGYDPTETGAVTRIRG